MIFPKVTKRLGGLTSREKLSKATIKIVAAALFAASVFVSHPSGGIASSNSSSAASGTGGVITLFAPGSSTGPAGVAVIAQHQSHQSHQSHVSHGSHCSGYSYC